MSQEYKEIAIVLKGGSTFTVDQAGYDKIIQAKTKKAALVSVDVDTNVYGVSVIETDPDNILFISKATDKDIKERKKREDKAIKKQKAELEKQRKKQQEFLEKQQAEADRKREEAEESEKKKGLFGRKK